MFSENTTSLLDYFGQHIGSTTWYGVLSAFYEIEKSTKIYASNNATWIKSVHYMPDGRGLNLSDSDVQGILASYIASGTLPADPNGAYIVMFRGDSNYDGWNQPDNPDGFCGYHSSVNIGKVNIHYDIIGNPATSSPINYGCVGYGFSPLANGDLGADSMVSVYAHELAETITDPNYDAWYSDVSYNECADLCNFDFNTLANWNLLVGRKKFLVQFLFQPHVGCVMSLQPMTQ